MSAPCPKRSFVRLPVDVDVARLTADLDAVPSWAWSASPWPYPHGAIQTALLRGGTSGTEADYFDPSDVVDHELLARMPYVRGLVGEEGPFGGATFVFLFRMAPRGRSRLHVDGMPVWQRHHRVHVPIVSHPEARLVADDRWLHLEVGGAWTFDNQSLHGFLNGDATRTHLIMDVACERAAMNALLQRASWVPGEPLPDEARRAVT